MSLLNLSLEEFKVVLSSTNVISEIIIDPIEIYQKNITTFGFFVICNDLDTFNEETLRKYKLVSDDTQASSGAMRNVMTHALNATSAQDAIEKAKAFIKDITYVNELIDKMIKSESNETVKERYMNIKQYLGEYKLEVVKL